MRRSPRRLAADRAWHREAAGSPPHFSAPHPTARGFTLLEILLAIALIALLSAALVSGAIQVVGKHSKSPDEVFWSATQAARRLALTTEHEVVLSFDPKEKSFVVSDGRSKQLFPLPALRDLSIDLFAGQTSSAGPVLIGGQLMEQQSLTNVTFYPDGTCQPFRAQVRLAGSAHVVSIDPWTCAQVLRRTTDKG